MGRFCSAKVKAEHEVVKDLFRLLYARGGEFNIQQGVGIFQDIVDHPAEDVVLSLEMAVDRPVAHVGHFADLGDGGLGVALADKRLFGCIQNEVARDAAAQVAARPP